MAWTIIPDTDIAQDKPIKAETGLALRDNAIAIANGDSGAPRVQNVALAPVFPTALAKPVAGSTHLIKRISDRVVPIPIGGAGLVSCGILIDGVVRVYVEQRRIIGTIRTQVLVNGVLAAQWDTSSSGFVARTVDVGVDIGHIIEVFSFMTTSGSGENGEMQNIRIFSGTRVAAAG